MRYIENESLGVAQVHLQGQRRDEQERQGGEQGQPVGGLHLDHVEHTLERREDEGAGDQSRDEGIQDDEDAPLQLDFVGIDEPVDTVHDALPYRTAPSRPL